MYRKIYGKEDINLNPNLKDYLEKLNKENEAMDIKRKTEAKTSKSDIAKAETEIDKFVTEMTDALKDVAMELIKTSYDDLSPAEKYGFLLELKEKYKEGDEPQREMVRNLIKKMNIPTPPWMSNTSEKETKDTSTKYTKIVTFGSLNNGDIFKQVTFDKNPYTFMKIAEIITDTGSILNAIVITDKNSLITGGSLYFNPNDKVVINRKL